MKQAAMAAAAEYTWSNAALQYEAIFKEIGVKDVLNGTSVRWSNKAVKTVIFQQVLVGWGVALIKGPPSELHVASFFFVRDCTREVPSFQVHIVTGLLCCLRIRESSTVFPILFVCPKAYAPMIQSMN